jgi:hypothetical protein
MAIYGGPDIVTDGLVLHLDAANNKSYPGSGTIWYDLSNNSNNGSLVNGVSYSSNNKGSFVFDGVDDFININEPLINFSPNLWTMCLWMNPNNQYSRFLTPNSNGIDQWLEYDNSNQRVNVAITQSSDVNNRNRSGTSSTIPINNWSYFCLSINNLNIKIYANSLLTDEYNESISIGNWSGLWRLGQRGNNTSWYSGLFSNFMVFNKELSAEEIKKNYNALKGRFES